jgi:glycerol-3-phosphate acyltransferase PlsY
VSAFIIIVIAAYLLGSIPTGYLVTRAKGIDIRAVGSGNIGATNVFRILGKPAGFFVLGVDGLKGFAACSWLADFVIRSFAVAPDKVEGLKIIAGVGAVLGHNYTCWLKFKGGKGVATSAGVFLALAPRATGIALGTWLVVFALSRYVSVASIAAAVALPTAVWFTQNSRFLGIVTTALGLLAICKHKSNVQRLIRGTEGRVSFKTKGTAT